MKSAIGVITAPADVFAQRYSEFYEDLASDSTGPSFAFLAAFVERSVLLFLVKSTNIYSIFQVNSSDVPSSSEPNPKKTY